MEVRLQDHVRNEIDKTRTLLSAILADAELLASIEAVGRSCAGAIQRGNKILFAGNGGSAADAQHLAGELVGRLEFERGGLPALALNADTAVLTALANDYGYEEVFARQIDAIGRPGDVFIALSTSGRSRNVIRGLEQARAKGLMSVGMTGQTGGAMRALCDALICIPSTETQKIQEAHIVVGHVLCALIERQMFAGTRL
ncbi:MAG: D-sedoheptulose-7-phosphate isomerase [Pseudomonadota bacterium]